MTKEKLILDTTPPGELNLTTCAAPPPALTGDMIREILEMYNVSAKTLSKLLGWNSDAIFRYLAGNIPSKMRPQRISAMIELYVSPMAMSALLDSKKSELSATVYKKARKRVNEILLSNSEKYESNAKATSRFMTERIVDLVLYQPGAIWSEDEKKEILSYFPLYANK